MNLMGISIFDKQPFVPESNEKIIASWNSEKIGTEEYIFSLTLYDDKTVNVDVSNSHYSTNSFYDIDELEDCDYKSDIIFWGMEHTAEEDIYVSVVPKDCDWVKIDDETFKPKIISIIATEKEYLVNIIIATVKHKDVHEISLVDKYGTSHKRPLL